ncbi:MAG: polysaccharide biosynthesis C-terminal domain-containing protein, partial [Paraclostridium sp.]
SISSIICTITLFISLYKKAGYFGQDKILWTLGKSLFSVVIMSVAVTFIYNNLVTVISSTIITLGISISIGGIIYLGLMYILKVDELNMIIEMGMKIKNNLICKIKNKKSELI